MVIFASNNKDKIEQVKTYLGKDVVGLKEYGVFVDVEENADTFIGNALKKAREIYELTHKPVVADDSGLCIDALDGWPGVYTHRFLGENSTESERNQEILRRMEGVPTDKRTCHVICALVYIDADGKEHCFIGQFDSLITLEEKGENNFGFDSIVYADKDCTKTIAELTNEEKLKINARGFALKQLSEYCNKHEAHRKYEEE